MIIIERHRYIKSRTIIGSYLSDQLQHVLGSTVAEIFAFTHVALFKIFDRSMDAGFNGNIPVFIKDLIIFVFISNRIFCS